MRDFTTNHLFMFQLIYKMLQRSLEFFFASHCSAFLHCPSAESPFLLCNLVTILYSLHHLTLQLNTNLVFIVVKFYFSYQIIFDFTLLPCSLLIIYNCLWDYRKISLVSILIVQFNSCIHATFKLILVTAVFMKL